MMNEMLYIIFGWIMGILSTICGTLLLEKIRQNINKNKITNGILVELNELLITISATCYSLTYKYGKYNVKFLNWWKPYYYNIKSSGRLDILSDNNKNIEKIFDMDETDLFKYKNANIEDPKKSKIIPPISTPYIDTNLNFLAEYGEKYKQQIFGIKREVNFLNNDISEVIFYHRKTFDDISTANHDIIVNNLNRLFTIMSRRTKDITELINAFVQSY
ncbi:MAG: hypothetical protein GWP19_05805 [Planctomycetia bacterium]|nr:hypothetical protein [Planctomycetia bacterium]